MECEEIRLIKQSEKSTVHLVREKGGEQIFIRKILKGRHSVYLTLENCRHPFLPGLYEVAMTGESTTLTEEYIEGQSLGDTELSEEQLPGVVRELCSVLEYLHGKGIIHRDIKPSNIILAKDGHIRLIDFDASRMMKDNVEQDTKLLGTRGYAPPEQYGFAQTDGRADIYALGVTLEQILGDQARKPRYRRLIRKCTNLNPDKRYQSARQVKKAFFRIKYSAWYGFAAVLLLVLLCFGGGSLYRSAQKEDMVSGTGGLSVLPAPGNLHWDGGTGTMVWDNVPEAGDESGEAGYHYRLYRRDTAAPPDPEKDMWDLEGYIRGNGGIDTETSTYSVNVSFRLEENGFYYFSVSADGDGIQHASSPYVMSETYFEYTGESAPMLPVPAELEWKMFETDEGREYYATWGNLDDYEDRDSFNVTVYDKDGNYVMNNIWTKEMIVSKGQNGIRIRREFLTDLEGAYRFTVEVYSSRPNEYRPYLISDPVPEECYSPWYYR